MPMMLVMEASCELMLMRPTMASSTLMMLVCWALSTETCTGLTCPGDAGQTGQSADTDDDCHAGQHHWAC